jgi:hypothetical protein
MRLGSRFFRGGLIGTEKRSPLLQGVQPSISPVSARNVSSSLTPSEPNIMRSASGKRQRQAARIASGTQAGHGYGPGPALSVLKSPFSEATPSKLRAENGVP